VTRPKRLQPGDPPADLSDRARELWNSAVPAHADGLCRQATVAEALRALNRADQARAIIDAEGMTFVTEGTGTVHVHPLVKVERESRQLFFRLWSGLGLNWRQEQEGGAAW
jgi:phage terminase small subunit